LFSDRAELARQRAGNKKARSHPPAGGWQGFFFGLLLPEDHKIILLKSPPPADGKAFSLLSIPPGIAIRRLAESNPQKLQRCKAFNLISTPKRIMK
jgi:hypothetical protein